VLAIVISCSDYNNNLFWSLVWFVLTLFFFFVRDDIQSCSGSCSRLFRHLFCSDDNRIPMVKSKFSFDTQFNIYSFLSSITLYMWGWHFFWSYSHAYNGKYSWPALCNHPALAPRHPTCTRTHPCMCADGVTICLFLLLKRQLDAPVDPTDLIFYFQIA
jgi:hypothetical protein